MCTFRQFTNFQKRLCFADVRQIRLWNRYLHKTNQTVRCTEKNNRNLLVSPCIGLGLHVLGQASSVVTSSYIPRQDSRSMASASVFSCEGGKIKLSESCARRKSSSLGDTPSRIIFFRALKKVFRPSIGERRRLVSAAWVRG